MAGRDRALDLAINCIEALRSVFLDDKDVLKGFRARARDIPSQIYYGGLTYAIAFIVAKASKEKVSGYDLMNQALESVEQTPEGAEQAQKKTEKDKLVELFNKWKKGECKEGEAEKRREEREGKPRVICVEKEAYELYGACLMRAIMELALATDQVKDVITLLRELNDPTKQAITVTKVLNFAEWLKRMAEATIPGG